MLLPSRATCRCNDTCDAWLVGIAGYAAIGGPSSGTHDHRLEHPPPLLWACLNPCDPNKFSEICRLKTLVLCTKLRPLDED